VTSLLPGFIREFSNIVLVSLMKKLFIRKVNYEREKRESMLREKI